MSWLSVAKLSVSIAAVVVIGCAPGCERQSQTGGTAPAESAAPSESTEPRSHSDPPAPPTAAPVATPKAMDAPSDPAARQASADKTPATDQPVADTQVRREFDPSGAVVHEWHVKITPNGAEVKHGVWTKWQPTGERYLQGEYVDGMRHGPLLSWHRNGRPRGTGQFRDDQKDGVWTMWADDGVKRSRRQYVNDVLHGTSTDWHADGGLKESGEYANGEKDGVWVHIDSSGERTEIHWDNGTIIE